MARQNNIESPFANIDLDRLYYDFPSLLQYTASMDARGDGLVVVGQGLTIRERRIFRFGLLTGLGEWGAAVEMLHSLANDELLTGSELERAVSEAGQVLGLPACLHLRSALVTLKLRGPVDVAEAVQMASTIGYAGLSDRELFALGLGITWGGQVLGYLKHLPNPPCEENWPFYPRGILRGFFGGSCDYWRTDRPGQFRPNPGQLRKYHPTSGGLPFRWLRMTSR